MGHYTRYRLTVLPAKSVNALGQLHRFYDDVESDKISGVDEYSIQATLDSSDTIKWYSYDEDMLKVSRFYPQLTFLLEGESKEDEVDVWRCYYKNGKSLHQNAILSFEEPDLSKLD